MQLNSPKKKKSLVYLATDAWGENGGIAHYNRMMVINILKLNFFNSFLFFLRNKPNELPSDLGKIFSYTPINSESKFIYFLKYILCLPNIPFCPIIFCGHINLLPVAIITKLFRGGKIILSIHGIEAWNGNLIKKILTYKFVDHVFSVTNFTFNRFKSWSNFTKNHSIISNCVDLKKFSSSKIELNEVFKKSIHRFAKGRAVIASLGRLQKSERYKGFDKIIDLFSKHPELQDSFCYLLCGDGDDYDEFQRHIIELELTDSVFLTGYLSDSEKRTLLGSCDLFILAGTGEGFGIVLIEALASGARVVGSRLDGSMEALKYGELGAVIDPNDELELYDCIANFRKIPAGDPLALTQFDIEYVQNELRKELKDLF